MTTSAKSAHGMKLYRGGTGTPRTGGTAIEEVVSLDMPDWVDEVLDATSMDSTAVERIMAGCVDYGAITGTMNWTGGTGQLALRGDLGGAAGAWYVNFPGSTGQPQIYFQGLISRFKPPGGVLRGKQVAEFTLTITGAAAWSTQG